jgi:probable HAF family extracellular repeat protein
MRIILLALVAILAAQGRVFGGGWNLIDLGTLGGSESFGWTLNNLGEVAGNSRLYQDSDSHAFFYSSGVMHDIAPIDSGDLRTVDFGLNDNGQIASGVMLGGMYYPAIYDTRTAQTTILGSFGGNFYGFTGASLAINNSGAVAGYSYLSSGDQHAFVYRNGIMTDLGGGLARAINNSGMIAGSSSAGAAVWINNSRLDLIPGIQSDARGINDAGAVVGERLQPGYDEAFVWSNGNLQGLGALTPGRNSGAYDINNNGDIVGYSDVASLTFSTNPLTGHITIATNYVEHGFLFKDGAMMDLNSLIATNSGWVISGARSINDSDQILCWGQSNNGLYHSFILQVPEPCVSALLILGSAGVVACRRRNRKGRRNFSRTNRSTGISSRSG